MAQQLIAKPFIVLLVEDELLLRLHARDLLEEAGYEVLEAGDADEAIEILESRSDIRIVFTDVQMPGSMDGLKLARAIRDRWPPVELIITSGMPAPDKDAIPERGIFFPKPYDGRSLQRAISSFRL